MTPLDPKAPGESLYRVAFEAGKVGSLEELGRKRRPKPVSHNAVGKMIRGGAAVQVDTLAAYAEACGYRLVLGVEPKEG